MPLQVEDLLTTETAERSHLLVSKLADFDVQDA